MRQSYHTRTRSEILSFLEANRDRTVSATDIAAHLKGEGVSVSESTIYRYLTKLCEDGKAISYKPSGESGRVFQYTGLHTHCSEHLHLQCQRCGRLLHLDCDFMSELLSHLESEHGFLLNCEGSLFYGLCRRCRDQEAARAFKEKKEDVSL